MLVLQRVLVLWMRVYYSWSEMELLFENRILRTPLISFDIQYEKWRELQK